MTDTSAAPPSALVDPRQVFSPGTVLGGRYRLDGLIVPEAPVFFASDLERGVHVVVQAIFDPAVAAEAPRLHRWLKSQRSAWMAPSGLAILDTGLEPSSGAAFIVIQLAPGLPAVGFVDPSGPVQASLREWLTEMMPEAQTMAMPAAVIPAAHQPPPEPEEGNVRIQRGGLILAGLLAVMSVVYLFTAEDRIPPGSQGNQQEGIVRRTNYIEGGGAAGRRFDGPGNIPTKTEGTDDLRRLPRIVVDSQPQGAAVYSGGRQVGSTPVRISRPPDGDRVDLRLKMDGYLEKSMSVSSRDPNRVSTTLFKSGESLGGGGSGGAVEKPDILKHPGRNPAGETKKPMFEQPALGEME